MWCLTWSETFPKRCPLPAARRPLLVSWPPALLQRRSLTVSSSALGARLLSASSLGKCLFFRLCEIDVCLPRDYGLLGSVFCECVHLVKV